MIVLFQMVIFQLAMLVYQRVSGIILQVPSYKLG